MPDVGQVLTRAVRRAGLPEKPCINLRLLTWTSGGSSTSWPVPAVGGAAYSTTPSVSTDTTSVFVARLAAPSVHFEIYLKVFIDKPQVKHLGVQFESPLHRGKEGNLKQSTTRHKET